MAADAPKSECAVTRGEVDLDWYAARDGEWRALGLSAPARRALVNEGLLHPRDLGGYTWAEISALHGMGKSTLPKIQHLLRST